MAALSTRSRRTQENANEEVETPPAETIDEPKGKSRNSRSARPLTVSIESPIEAFPQSSAPLIEEQDSNAPSASNEEEVSSNASESGSSNKSSSVTSDETSNKTKEELIKTAHDLDSQLKELIKIYMDEKRLFIDKSIHMLETESHPDWVEKIEELRSKRQDSIRIANERQRLKMKAIMAEYDYALKNISDEFQAAESEIIDEFTTKRKRRNEKIIDQNGSHKVEPIQSCSGIASLDLDESQIQNDLSAINRTISKTL